MHSTYANLYKGEQTLDSKTACHHK